MRGLNSRLKGGGSLVGLHGGLSALVCMQCLRGVMLIEFSAWYASTRTIRAKPSRHNNAIWRRRCDRTRWPL